jgi:hypothetical protein
MGNPVTNDTGDKKPNLKISDFFTPETEKLLEKTSDKMKSWSPVSNKNDWNLEVDEDENFINPKFKLLEDVFDKMMEESNEMEKGPKVIEIVNNGVKEIVATEQITNAIDEFKDIMSLCKNNLKNTLSDFAELQDTTLGYNDEFLFLTENFGNKPEDNKKFSDKVKNEMLKYDQAWIEHSPGEDKINPTPNITPDELTFGAQTYDMNFGKAVNVDNVYVNGQSVKSIFSSVEPQNEREAQKLTDYKKAFVTASAMGREDKIDFRFINPENEKEKSDMMTLKTSVPNEMKNVSFWGEVGNFMSALGKGDFGKMKASIDNLKTVTGLSSSKDKKHENDLKTDAITARSERREKINQDELSSDGKRVEKKRIEGNKVKMKTTKTKEMSNEAKTTDPKKKR